MLTARFEEMDVVVGLEAGADDYLTKPFRFGELLARVRRAPAAQRRRSAGAGDARGRGLVVDVGARRVTVGGDEVTLRTKEFELLTRLASDAGTAVSRETLMADVWDAHWYGSTKTLDVHVAALRRKLAAAARRRAAGDHTLRGHGYRMELAVRTERPDGRHLEVRRRIVVLAVLAAVLATTLFGVPLGYAVAQSFLGDEQAEWSGSPTPPRSRWPPTWLAASTEPPRGAPGSTSPWASTDRTASASTGTGPARADAVVRDARPTAGCRALTTSPASWSWRCR